LLLLMIFVFSNDRNRNSNGMGFYVSVWDPQLIVLQILCVQARLVCRVVSVIVWMMSSSYLERRVD